MFSKKTLFVLGAGASAELGFPLGIQLASKIGELMTAHDFRSITERQSWMFNSVAAALNLNTGDTFRAGGVISRGIQFSNSIDLFLSQHQSNKAVVLLSKVAIVEEILIAERASSLRRTLEEGAPLDRSYRENWLWRFVMILLESVTPSTLLKSLEDVAFITFNYDRSLEVFLTHAIAEALNLPINLAADAVKTITILRPYGYLGSVFDTTEGARYGWTDNQLYIPMSKRILTFNESISDERIVHNIQYRMNWAEQIVFLGFGYHKPNMDLIHPPDGLMNQKIFGTTAGLSGPEINTVRNRLSQLFGEPLDTMDEALAENRYFDLSSLKCGPFLKDYATTLMS